MIKSSNTTQELRLQRSGQSPTTMDSLKTSFLPNLSLDTGDGVIDVMYCPICGQHCTRQQELLEHMHVCHHSSAIMLPAHIVAVPPPASLNIEYPCLSCDDKFPSAQDLDEHIRIAHQAFLARCLSCGLYGISSTSLQEGSAGGEYKCMHCAAVCTAEALAGQQAYLEEQSIYMETQTLQEEEENPLHGDEDEEEEDEEEHLPTTVLEQQLQQEEEELQLEDEEELSQQQLEQQQLELEQHQQQLELEQQQLEQQQHELEQQHHQQQQQLKLEQQQLELEQQQLQQEQLQLQQEQEQLQQQLRVPPLTVKLPKSSDNELPHVVIKQEPMCNHDGRDTNSPPELSPETSIPVYAIQQRVMTSPQSSVVVSPADTLPALRNQSGSSRMPSIAAAAAIVNSKVRHKCPICPKTFKTPSTLAMHKKVHTGEADHTPKERPYTCSYCGKSFTQSNTLKQHTRIHTGEKPFHCGYCEKSFSVKDYLTKHIRTHTGEKPYSCSYCDKKFTQRSALTVHTTKLHPL